MTATELAPRFFLAAMVILLVCRAVSIVVSRIGQPPVVGEMIAGVLLGPSLLGLVWPSAESELFPTVLRPILYVAGQVGLVTLMFQAGRELRSYLQRSIAGTAAAVSAAGITIPVILGIAMTLIAYHHVNVFVPNVSIGVTAAFVGVALAITAFPMLARIITERGLSGSRHGSIALASGALDDVVAWIGLAVVLSVAADKTWPAAKAIGGAIIFAVVLIVLIRPALRWLLRRTGLTDSTIILVVLSVLFAAAWFTDEIGLYAVFGAFSVGMVMPNLPAVERVTPTTNAITVVFVPMFFTYSGLNTRFSLLTNTPLLIFSLAAIVLATVGKFGACRFAARMRGESPATSARLGALMNARGLMQLIALNVGLAAHIVNNEMFTALVLVALITTMTTAPALTWIDRRESKKSGSVVADRSGGSGESVTLDGLNGHVAVASLPHERGA